MPISDNVTQAARYTHLGVTFAASAIAMFFLGFWLDGKLHTRPMLAIIGAFLGATAGLINLVRTLNRFQKEQEEKDEGDVGNQRK